MDTLKTAFVVLLLLVVLYGVYVFLNKDATPGPSDQGWALQSQTMEPPQVEIGGPAGDAFSGGGPVIPPAGSASAAPGFGHSIDDHTMHDHSPSGDDPGASPSAQADYSSAGYDSPAPSQPPPLPPTGFAPGPEVETPVNEDPSEDVTAASEGGYQSQYQPNTVGGNPAADPTPSPPTPPNYTDAVGDSGYTSAENHTAASAAVDPSTETRQSASLAVENFTTVRATAMRLAQENKYKEALMTLSSMYGADNLTAEEERQLLDLLDPLAGKVVFSTEHLTEPAHTVRRGETLVGIAAKYNVPVELLRNINGIQNPQVLPAGERLKVVRGPFRAEVNLKRQELVLFLGQLYAGRFPVSIGADPTPASGDYAVKTKERGHSYYGQSGQTLPANHANNPYGGWWLDLGGDVSIHGSAAAGDNQSAGCISLSPVDAGDVYGILSVGSRVLVR